MDEKLNELAAALRLSRETNTRLNRRIGQLEHELRRQQRAIANALTVTDHSQRMWRETRIYHQNLRRQWVQMRNRLDNMTIMGRIRRFLGL